jgi:hypothetical protein
MLYKGVKTNLSPFFIAGVLSLFLILSAIRVSGCDERLPNSPAPAVTNTNAVTQEQTISESKCDIYTLDASRTKVATNLKPPTINIPDPNQVIVSSGGGFVYIDSEHTLHYISGNAELCCPNHH